MLTTYQHVFHVKWNKNVYDANILVVVSHFDGYEISMNGRSLYCLKGIFGSGEEAVSIDTFGKKAEDKIDDALRALGRYLLKQFNGTVICLTISCGRSDFYYSIDHNDFD